MTPCLRLTVAVLIVAAQAASAFGDAPPSAVSLALDIAPTGPYVREAVSVTVTLRVAGVTLRNIAYPHLQGDLTGAVFSPPDQREEQWQGSDVTVYRFTATVTPARAGKARLGPASVDCDLSDDGLEGSFFGATAPRRITVTSPSRSLTVSPLPAAGRPAAFSGAVGSFKLAAVARPSTVSPGEPITVSTTIAGTGELAEASCPSLAGPGLRTYPARPTRLGAKLNCEQVVIPLDAAAILPPVQWAYFDPRAGRYRLLQTPLSGVRLVSHPAPAANVGPDAPRKTTLRKERTQPRPAWLVMGAVVLLPLAVRMVRNREKRRHATAMAAGSATPPASLPLAAQLAAAERALRLGDVELFYTSLFRVLQLLIAEVSGQSAAAICALPEGVELPAAAEIASLWERSISVRYGNLQTSSAEMGADLVRLQSLALRLPKL